jgi:hypothetical protein
MNPLATGISKTMLGLYTVDNAWKKTAHTPLFWHSNYWHFFQRMNHNNFVTCLFQSSWDNLCFPDASCKLVPIPSFTCPSIWSPFFSVYDFCIVIVSRYVGTMELLSNDWLVFLAVTVTKTLCVPNVSGTQNPSVRSYLWIWICHCSSSRQLISLLLWQKGPLIWYIPLRTFRLQFNILGCVTISASYNAHEFATWIATFIFKLILIVLGETEHVVRLMT